MTSLPARGLRQFSYLERRDDEAFRRVRSLVVCSVSVFNDLPLLFLLMLCLAILNRVVERA